MATATTSGCIRTLIILLQRSGMTRPPDMITNGAEISGFSVAPSAHFEFSQSVSVLSCFWTSITPGWFCAEFLLCGSLEMPVVSKALVRLQRRIKERVVEFCWHIKCSAVWSKMRRLECWEARDAFRESSFYA